MPLKRSERAAPRLVYPGNVTLQSFLDAIDYVIETYFKMPTYWRIDDCPYFSIYELYRMVQQIRIADHWDNPQAKSWWETNLLELTGPLALPERPSEVGQALVVN